MCDPVTIAGVGMAVSAGSTALNFVGQQQQATAQTAAYNQNKVNATAAFQDTQASLTQRQMQEQDSAGTQKFDAGLKAQADRATTITAAGESGVSGLSINGLLGDLSGSNARYNDRVDQQTDWTVNQLQAEKTSAGDTAASRINSMRPGLQPSLLGAGLQIAGAGVSAYTGYKQLQKLS